MNKKLERRRRLESFGVSIRKELLFLAVVLCLIGEFCLLYSVSYKVRARLNDISQFSIEEKEDIGINIEPIFVYYTADNEEDVFIKNQDWLKYFKKEYFCKLNRNSKLALLEALVSLETDYLCKVDDSVSVSFGTLSSLGEFDPLNMKIYFSIDCIDDPEKLIDICCHECEHVKQWFLLNTSLPIEELRYEDPQAVLEKMKYEYSHYCDGKDGNWKEYSEQIIEKDAFLYSEERTRDILEFINQIP